MMRRSAPDGPRVVPGNRRELGWINAAFARGAGVVTRTGPPNVFTTLGRSRGLFRAWLVYSAMMMPFGRLSRRDTELVILRIAALRDCEYERRHHEQIARRIGVSQPDIVSVRHEDPDQWPQQSRTVLTAATELVQHGDIRASTWQLLREQLDDRRIVELVLLCGHYNGLATALHALRVQPD